jgi:hypothetical protein
MKRQNPEHVYPKHTQSRTVFVTDPSKCQRLLIASKAPSAYSTAYITNRIAYE